MSGEVSLSKPKARVSKVLERLAALVAEGDEDFAVEMAPILDHVFDRMQSNDTFGTEGQIDPRGDFRNGVWSMRRVEGVDK